MGFPFVGGYRARIECAVDRKAGFRHGPLRSMRWVNKERRLRFRVVTDVPEPFDLYWKSEEPRPGGGADRPAERADFQGRGAAPAHGAHAVHRTALRRGLRREGRAGRGDGPPREIATPIYQGVRLLAAVTGGYQMTPCSPEAPFDRPLDSWTAALVGQDSEVLAILHFPRFGDLPVWARPQVPATRLRRIVHGG
jgi:hypothetical protein